MGLRLKFNLVLSVVFLAGLAVTAQVSRSLLQKNARAEIVHNAELIMESALAIRSYTVGNVSPLLVSTSSKKFLPETVPAFAATETLNKLKEKYPDYFYKEATLNPTNPRDRAMDWEGDLIQAFKNTTDTKELVGERDSSTGRMLYIARPIQIKNAACLRCHSAPEIAPKSMLELYGVSNGFGWKEDEIVGAQIVSVPMDLPIRNAEKIFITFIESMIAVFAFTFIVINLMMSWLIVQPIARLSATADKVSTGNFDEPEFVPKGKDEVSLLANSFNRMRRSLEKALQMFED